MVAEGLMKQQSGREDYSKVMIVYAVGLFGYWGGWVHGMTSIFYPTTCFMILIMRIEAEISSYQGN